MLTTRTFHVRADTIDESSRSVEAVIATERVAQVFDWESFRVIDEVLRMDGVQIPAGGQVPLLDSHSSYRTSSVIGSTRNLAIEGDKLVGRNVFSSLAEDQWVKTREGHLTDNSVGYRVSAFETVPAGKKKKVGDRFYTAGERALRVSTEWALHENSIVPIGADPDAKNRVLRAALDIDDPDVIRRLIAELQSRLSERPPAYANEAGDVDDGRERMGMALDLVRGRIPA